MAGVPTWIQKENDQKAKAASEAEVAARRQVDAANFIQARGPAIGTSLLLHSSLTRSR